ncbi:hypothetical protein [Rhodoferax aquaticus]|uniref:Nucleotidyltransferase family protein n=1 Tax=Rhodoferax aquaticus TaxID=2527691 RepID=A0A515EQU5_9BURK|nr:hypothetical protein [Rhodoferax aquaticus]QDL55029.1 hypothetical protein EXZ61_13115 [Rhodoferax aquaticus]
MPPTLDEFKQLLATKQVREIAEEIVIGGDAIHVSNEQLQFIQDEICAKFGLVKNDLTLHVVGSAKLGYSIVEKTGQESGFKPRYRSYRHGQSDVDIAVVSGKLFQILWHELAVYSHGSRPFPWESKRLGDYMLIGWLRPDHFPKIPSPSKLASWSEVFRSLSTNHRLDYKKYSGGLYFSRQHLLRYHERAILECQHLENKL